MIRITTGSQALDELLGGSFTMRISFLQSCVLRLVNFETDMLVSRNYFLSEFFF